MFNDNVHRATDRRPWLLQPSDNLLTEKSSMELNPNLFSNLELEHIVGQATAQHIRNFFHDPLVWLWPNATAHWQINTCFLTKLLVRVRCSHVPPYLRFKCDFFLFILWSYCCTYEFGCCLYFPSQSEPVFTPLVPCSYHTYSLASGVPSSSSLGSLLSSSLLPTQCLFFSTLLPRESHLSFPLLPRQTPLLPSPPLSSLPQSVSSPASTTFSLRQSLA